MILEPIDGRRGHGIWPRTRFGKVHAGDVQNCARPSAGDREPALQACHQFVKPRSFCLIRPYTVQPHRVLAATYCYCSLQDAERVLTWRAVFALLVGGTFLYLEVFVLTATPRLASGDQAIHLNSASRLLQGQIIYRDCDYFTLPGPDVLYAVLFKLFGSEPGSLR